ncbi:penicillin-binding protein activator LpoB [Sphingomonas sp. ac-8]|uniref:penicillin-binding protein activator LpoB n=1 Tax=Sphingomonas sp. ac-8 TaxID=3242977 RepID=UPI003A80464F
MKSGSIVAGLTMLAALVAEPAMAQSSGRKAQAQGQADIPRCTRNLGSVAIVEPDTPWWREFNLGSPEAILRIFVQRSGCFTIVNRGRSMASRNMERALADDGELQANANLGKGQVRAADYFLQPDIVTGNKRSGGNNIGGAIGGLLGNRLGGFGRAAGNVSINKKEANVTLSLVNSRTTEEQAMAEGYYRKSDISFAGSGAGSWWDGFAAVGASGYSNTAIGQVIVLAYLDAYTKLVSEMGGLPANASAAAPQAR